MVKLLKNTARGAGIMLVAGLLVAAPVPPGTVNGTMGGQPTTARFAQAGTVNYVEGQVTVDGRPVTEKNIGSVVVAQGHVLQTADGKAEMLLTPGVFLRLAPNSAVRMTSPSLSDTRVELMRGQAMMEVAYFEKENHIQVAVGSAAATVKARGIYEFAANPASARAFDGKAEVAMNDRNARIEKGDQVALDATNPKLKTHDFNLKNTEATDDLYAWSKLRADYTAQANMSAAERYETYGPGYGYGPWYGTGWYWDPYFSGYAFLPGDGFLWDPFGFGFFSPGYWGAYAPYYGFGRYGYPVGRYGRGAYGFRGAPGGAITRNSAVGGVLGGGARSTAGGFGGVRGAGGFGGVRGAGGLGVMRGAGGFGGMHGGGFGGMHGGGGRR